MQQSELLAGGWPPVRYDGRSQSSGICIQEHNVYRAVLGATLDGLWPRGGRVLLPQLPRLVEVDRHEHRLAGRALAATSEPGDRSDLASERFVLLELPGAAPDPAHRSGVGRPYVVIGQAQTAHRTPRRGFFDEQR